MFGPQIFQKLMLVDHPWGQLCENWEYRTFLRLALTPRPSATGLLVHTDALTTVSACLMAINQSIIVFNIIVLIVIFLLVLPLLLFRLSWLFSICPVQLMIMTNLNELNQPQSCLTLILSAWTWQIRVTTPGPCPLIDFLDLDFDFKFSVASYDCTTL